MCGIKTEYAMPDVVDLSKRPCVICGEPIGFNRPFYGPDDKPVHCDCQENAFQITLRRLSLEASRNALTSRT